MIKIWIKLCISLEKSFIFVAMAFEKSFQFPRAYLFTITEFLTKSAQTLACRHITLHN